MKISTFTELFSPAFAADWEQACRDDAELNNLGGRANVCFSVQAGAVGHFPITENPEAFLEYLRPALARLHARGE